jgi:hypothetical protein
MKLIHFAVGEVFQNLDNEKNSPEFFEFREVARNLDNEKNSKEFFEGGRFAEPDESARGHA